MCLATTSLLQRRYNKLMHKGTVVPGNELVMRIQPDEALYLKTFSKEPGLAQVVKPTVMDMKYATQFEGAYVGDAYERCACDISACL